MNAEKLFVSLGQDGEDALAVLLELLEPIALRSHVPVADFNQILVRRPAGGDGAARTPLDAAFARWETIRPEPLLWRRLEDLPWIDAFSRPGDGGRPAGFDRAGLAQKCWQEWVVRTVHDQSVPWYRPVTEALHSLQSCAARSGTNRSGVVHAVVIANLSDPVEAGMAYALGRFLRSVRLAEVRPVLVAILAPREEVAERIEFARGRGVAALADLCRDIDRLGYDDVVLLDGRLSESGHGVVPLSGTDMAAIVGQFLYGVSVSSRARAQLLRKQRRADREDGPLSTLTASGYGFNPSRFSGYAARRLILAAAKAPAGTDASLEELLDAGQSRTADDRVRRAPQPQVERRAQRFEDLLLADFAEFFRVTREQVRNSGYEELVREQFFEARPILEWPEAVHDLIAVVQQGIIEPIQPALEATARIRSRELGRSLEQELLAAFGPGEREGRLAAGTVVLASLRRLADRVPDLYRDAAMRSEQARHQEATDAAPHNREIGRLYDQLRREARLPPHRWAIVFRAVLAGLLVAIGLLLRGGDGILSFITRPVEALVCGGAAGLLYGVVAWTWFVVLRRSSCKSTVRQICEHLDHRCRIVLGRMRSAAMESYLEEIQLKLRVAAYGSGEPAPAAPAAGAEPPSGWAAVAELPARLRELAGAWNSELKAIRSELEQLESGWQQSSYLRRLPVLPRPGDTNGRQLFEAELDRPLAALLGAGSNGDLTPQDRLDALRRCLSAETTGRAATPGPERLADLPKWLRGFVQELAARTAGRLETVFYGQRSINELLQQMPADHLRWFPSARDEGMAAKLEDPNETIRNEARRNVIVEEMFARTAAPLALPGILCRRFVWLSSESGRDDDFLLRDVGLQRQADEESRDFLGDRSTTLLLAFERGISTRRVMEAAGSRYRVICEQMRKQYPDHPDLAPVPPPEASP